MSSLSSRRVSCAPLQAGFGQALAESSAGFLLLCMTAFPLAGVATAGMRFGIVAIAFGFAVIWSVWRLSVLRPSPKANWLGLGVLRMSAYASSLGIATASID